eukprot:scaffold432414_cov37-Prasinocladus_malaysianus.AAC.1
MASRLSPLSCWPGVGCTGPIANQEDAQAVFRFDVIYRRSGKRSRAFDDYGLWRIRAPDFRLLHPVGLNLRPR